MIAGWTHRAARVVELGDARSASDETVASRLDPRYADPLRRAPRGLLSARGLPFQLGDDPAARWLLLDRAVSIPLPGLVATHLVLFHFCDAWRDDAGERPSGSPIGWVLPVAEPLARVSVAYRSGGGLELMLRRRFEVNEGIIGWGSGAFLALPHRVEAAVDRRGPLPRQSEGRFAPTGHAGPMTILPGGWGAAQSGVEDHVPSATDELMFWLHAIDVSDAGRPRALDAISFSPIAGPGDGRLVVVGALTAFSGTATPLRWRPRRSLRVTGAEGLPVEVDLGIIARRRPIPAAWPDGGVMGWGVEAPSSSDAEEVEFSAADDAEIFVAEQSLSVQRLAASESVTIAGAKITLLPATDRRVRVDVVDGDGQASAARVRCQAHDGRYLAPLGHGDDVDAGIFQDLGADIVLVGEPYAYMDGSFLIDIPAQGASMLVVQGPHVAPVRIEIGPRDSSVGITLGQPIMPSGGRWVSGDTHVHFLSPSTALLQARAEGLNVVHLLATQLGDLHTSVSDLGGDQIDPAGRHAVWVGSENRQNMLGHIGLVGGARPLLPFASGGPPEGRIGGAVTHLMADWLATSHESGGLAIGAHFPLPMAEVAADIAAGLLDALELQCFDPTLDSPPIREWYRYLDAGYRLPLVGGTDKMSAGVPVGQVRTWARLDADAEMTLATWTAAIRSGRTFVTSGPILAFTVDGREPGDELVADAGASIEVELVARAVQPIISAVEVILDGHVVASRAVPAAVTELRLRETIRVERTGWLAGRSRSPYAIGSAFASSMAAHTSAVFLEVPGKPRAAADVATPLALIEGTRGWLRTLAPIDDPHALARFEEFLAEAERRLRRHVTTTNPVIPSGASRERHA